MEGLLGSNSEDANMNKPQLLPSGSLKFGIAQTRSSEDTALLLTEATAGYCSDARGVLEREIEWGQIKKQIKKEPKEPAVEEGNSGAPTSSPGLDLKDDTGQHSAFQARSFKGLINRQLPLSSCGIMSVPSHRATDVYQILTVRCGDITSFNHQNNFPSWYYKPILQARNRPVTCLKSHTCEMWESACDLNRKHLFLPLSQTAFLREHSRFPASTEYFCFTF